MLNLDEIQNTIEELENSSTTFDTCLKLASLYIVRDNYKNAQNPMETSANDTVITEYHDILPQYHAYVDIKKQYQLGLVAERAVETSIQKVCSEIQEFLYTMYVSTDMPKERDCIKNMLTNVINML